MGHCHFLDLEHRFHLNTDAFNGKVELGNTLVPPSGSDVLQQLQDVNVIFRRHKHNVLVIRRKRSDNAQLPYNWKKRSIFFSLPYWETLLLCHNLDMMHIEKNVCDNVVCILLNLDGKTKDNLKSRSKLCELNIRKALHPKSSEDGNRTYLPLACFTMTSIEKEVFCNVLKR